MTPEVLAGQLLVGGFDGTTLPDSWARALRAGLVAGAVLFKRNVGSVFDVALLNASIARACDPDRPPLIAVDQEGGRVARLGSPVVRLPPARELAQGGVARVEALGKTLGRELAALGFTMNFAPVLDVHVREDNPIIGDRAFATTPEGVIEHGLAFARGLLDGGVLGCGKHYPGHGDTTKDSHLELPVVDVPRERLERVDLAPFRAAARADIPALMSAHVLYPALDANKPATLSSAIATDLLRNELGYGGVLISDDLEMKALAAPIEETSVAAIEAGCDMLLVCSREDLLGRAREALASRIARDPAFRERARAAVARNLAMRKRVTPAPFDRARIEALFRDRS